ncbi:MAG: MinD/ParA family protein [Negativicutes bacterium]|nr:MinD/ParA family protein [Negativicutes bacterium]
MRDQAEKLRQLVQKSQSGHRNPIIKQPEVRARVITITSGKGGVGKTNLTVNLALALSALGQKVLIIDADFGLANVDVVLGCSSPYSLQHLLEDKCRITDIIADGPRGIKFMSGGSGIYQLANMSDAQLSRITSQISVFDRWADIILIDTGAGLNRNVLNFVMAADEVVIITTPEPTAITDAYAMMKTYSNHRGAAPVNLVINRVLDMGEGQLVVEKLTKLAQRFLGLKIHSLGFVYEDRNILNAVKTQVPLLLSFPESISTRCIEHIAQRMLYGEIAAKPQGIKGFFTKFLDMIW